ncbi:receptor-transporting protein 3-like [Eucyclogobius newberryi]|uniref:receptor-transporting protein 3-like n=1 Tax=Eucyclogobius newberryi TaxID=166745 RepID=UPI003B5A6541
MAMDWHPIFQSNITEYAGEDNWQLLFDDSIEENQQGAGWEQYIRRTCARFGCSLCRRIWPSNIVMVIFHMHLDNYTHQGTVKARVYRQKCKRCTEAQMEQPRNMEAHHIDALMENLVKNIRKKCYNEVFEEVYRDPAGVDVENPHEPQHCEGCIAGVCRQVAPQHPGGRGFRGMPRGRGNRRL